MRVLSFILNMLLLVGVSCSALPAFSAEYDLETLKVVLVKLHERYEEATRRNEQLTQELQRLNQKIPPAQRSSTLPPLRANTPSSPDKLRQATEELQKALNKIQDQQNQITALSERIEALQSSQMQESVTLGASQPKPTSLGQVAGGASPILPHADALQDLLQQASDLRKQGQWREAESKLLDALKSYPQEASVYYNLGNVYAGENNLLKAKTSYLKAIQQQHDFAQAYYNLGVICHRLKETDNAKQYLTRYLEMVPDSPHREAIEQLLSLNP
jgi:tetratricopeptide (TPR) repeat protein